MSDEDQHLCVLCNAKFKSKDALQEHFRKHGKELDMRGKPLGNSKMRITQCDLCNISFRSTSAAIQHRFNAHPNSTMKFYCHYCGQQFPVKIHRDHHQLSHDESESEKKEEHRKCEKCNVLFYNEKALKYHYRCNHQTVVHMLQPVATPPPSDKVKINSMNDVMRVYYCHLCGIEYLSKYNLRQHLRKRHELDEKTVTSVDVIKCTVCSAVFCSKKAYNAHNKYHKPNDLYITPEQRHKVTKVDLDFDIRRVEAVANKYVSHSNAPKRQIGHWWKLNNKQKMKVKETKQEMKQEIKEEIKEEINQECTSSFDDNSACTNVSSSPTTSRDIWRWNKGFPPANDSRLDHCEKVPSAFEENSIA